MCRASSDQRGYVSWSCGALPARPELGTRGLALNEAPLDGCQRGRQLKFDNRKIVGHGKARTGNAPVLFRLLFDSELYVFDVVETGLKCPKGAVIALSQRGPRRPVTGSATRAHVACCLLFGAASPAALFVSIHPLFAPG